MREYRKPSIGARPQGIAPTRCHPIIWWMHQAARVSAREAPACDRKGSRLRGVSLCFCTWKFRDTNYIDLVFTIPLNEHRVVEFVHLPHLCSMGFWRMSIEYWIEVFAIRYSLLPYAAAKLLGAGMGIPNSFAPIIQVSIASCPCFTASS